MEDKEVRELLSPRSLSGNEKGKLYSLTRSYILFRKLFIQIVVMRNYKLFPTIQTSIKCVPLDEGHIREHFTDKDVIFSREKIL